MEIEFCCQKCEVKGPIISLAAYESQLSSIYNIFAYNSRISFNLYDSRQINLNKMSQM